MESKSNRRGWPVKRCIERPVETVLFVRPRIRIRWLIKPAMSWRRAGEHRTHSQDMGVEPMQKINTIHSTTNTLMCTVCIARRMQQKYMSHVQHTQFSPFFPRKHAHSASSKRISPAWTGNPSRGIHHDSPPDGVPPTPPTSTASPSSKPAARGTSPMHRRPNTKSPPTRNTLEERTMPHANDSHERWRRMWQCVDCKRAWCVPGRCQIQNSTGPALAPLPGPPAPSQQPSTKNQHPSHSPSPLPLLPTTHAQPEMQPLRSEVI